jgi:antitoxin component of MazEF toxin-antitoxin module
MLNKVTTVIAVNKKSKCVRTVIPNAMAELLQLSAGDKIKWELCGSTEQGFYLKAIKGDKI